MKFSDATIQSTGAFLRGELERFDPKLYEPIAEYTWSRDIALRSDVSIADESTSFALAEYGLGSSGTGKGTKAWATQADGQLPTVSVGFKKTVLPVTPWAMGIDYTIFELEKAQTLGRPIDTLKLNAMRIRHQRDIDEQVYVGDAEAGVKGLLNQEGITPKDNKKFDVSKATAADVLGLVNGVLEEMWKATQYQRMGGKILLPPSFASILTAPYTLGEVGGFTTIGDWVKTKSIYKTVTGQDLDIQFCRWLTKENLGTSNDRIIAYDQSEDVVRFPLVPLQNTPVMFNGLKQSTVYYGALGAVEVVRPELVAYAEIK